MPFDLVLAFLEGAPVGSTTCLCTLFLLKSAMRMTKLTQGTRKSALEGSTHTLNLRFVVEKEL